MRQIKAGNIIINLYSVVDIAQAKACSIEAVQKNAVLLGYDRPGQGHEWEFTEDQKAELLNKIGDKPGPKTK